mmetsp:Transcript_4146/g.7932  ORF Transcript_4146/g.7932 Transcript_4146/m.7932 type:complete len:372 (-) Transcript_4146:156-1271(-)
MPIVNNNNNWNSEDCSSQTSSSYPPCAAAAAVNSCFCRDEEEMKEERNQNTTNGFLEVKNTIMSEGSAPGTNHEQDKQQLSATLVLVRPADEKNDHHQHQEEEDESSSCSSYDSCYDEDESRSPAFYLSNPNAFKQGQYDPSYLGSFPVSSVGSRPIDFIDEQGNLPLTKVSPILPAVAEDEEEDEEVGEDGELHIQLHPSTTTKLCHDTKTVGNEDDTLSTAGSFTESTTNSSSTKLQVVESPGGSSTRDVQFDSTYSTEQKPHDARTTPMVLVDSAYKNEDQKTRAILVMKDVIFRQRSAMKNMSKEKETLQNKYDFCKLQNKSLSKANKQLTAEASRVGKKNEALEQELEKLRMEINKILRWKQSDAS